MAGLLAIIPVIGEIIDKLIPDPQERMKMQIELAKLADAENARDAQNALGQIEVNKVEAASSSLFVAGWRPAIGWGCGAALLYNTLLAPLFGLGIADLGFLQTVLMAMLGIGGMRTVEKIKGVAHGMTSTPAVETETVKPIDPVAYPKKRVLPFSIPGL